MRLLYRHCNNTILSYLTLSLASTAHAFSTMTSSSSLALKMEETVCRYFQGVNDKDPSMIRSCFGTEATIWDVCSLSSSAKRTVRAQDLVDRCMEFVTAHPDCRVQFHYGPECGRSEEWVVAHWYETGTWTGATPVDTNDHDVVLEPTNAPMTVEGQTRFRVDPKTLLITEFVVTRTFTEWELAMAELRAKSGAS